jgi:hypothetical protein
MRDSATDQRMSDRENHLPNQCLVKAEDHVYILLFPHFSIPADILRKRSIVDHHYMAVK